MRGNDFWRNGLIALLFVIVVGGCSVAFSGARIAFRSAAASPQPDVTIPCGGTTLSGPPAEVAAAAKALGCVGTAPNATAVPTLVPTATASPTPLATPGTLRETGGVTDDATIVDLGVCRVRRNSNLRSSAQKADNVEATVSAGSEIKIAAVSEDNSWYQLENGLWIAAAQCEVITSSGFDRGDVITNTVTPMGGAIISGTAPFAYVPGGEGFGAWASDVVAPDQRSDCGRVWQSTNGENLPWTAVLCGWKTSNPAPKLQWPHATQLTVSGSGTVEFDLYRDMGAIQQLHDRGDNSNDPYKVANAKNAELGLGWFVQGMNAQVCVNGTCQPLNGGGVFQLGFPKDWTGHHHVVITVQNGQAQFWQGEKLTSVDTWPAQ